MESLEIHTAGYIPHETGIPPTGWIPPMRGGDPPMRGGAGGIPPTHEGWGSLQALPTPPQGEGAPGGGGSPQGCVPRQEIGLGGPLKLKKDMGGGEETDEHLGTTAHSSRAARAVGQEYATYH